MMKIVSVNVTLYEHNMYLMIRMEEIIVWKVFCAVRCAIDLVISLSIDFSKKINSQLVQASSDLWLCILLIESILGLEKSSTQAVACD